MPTDLNLFKLAGNDPEIDKIMMGMRDIAISKGAVPARAPYPTKVLSEVLDATLESDPFLKGVSELLDGASILQPAFLREMIWVNGTNAYSASVLVPLATGHGFSTKTPVAIIQALFMVSRVKGRFMVNAAYLLADISTIGAEVGMMPDGEETKGPVQ